MTTSGFQSKNLNFNAIENWQIDLDRSLTTDHEGERWIEYTERVGEAHSEEFYHLNENWILESNLYNDILNDVYHRGHEPEYSAMLIERIHSLYGLKYCDKLYNKLYTAKESLNSALRLTKKECPKQTESLKAILKNL